MIGIIVVTHSDLGQGLLNAVALIAGEQPCAKAIGLFHGDGIEEFEDMPMMVEALTGRDGITVEMLEENCLAVATSSIFKLEDVFAENSKFVEEEEDESDF